MKLRPWWVCDQEQSLLGSILDEVATLPLGARTGDLGYANAPTPVMSRPTMSVCMVSVPS